MSDAEGKDGNDGDDDEYGLSDNDDDNFYLCMFGLVSPTMMVMTMMMANMASMIMMTVIFVSLSNNDDDGEICAGLFGLSDNDDG